MRLTVFLLIFLGVMVFGAFDQEAFLFVQHLKCENTRLRRSQSLDDFRRRKINAG